MSDAKLSKMQIRDRGQEIVRIRKITLLRDCNKSLIKIDW